ncbi:unnamed protein product [Lactuca saligna]|uniref:Uncharacterized protein n=1 Tax=Lactuca saligna TaxID=75948 RepID=A0AA35ZEM2_LACSI|nr:unnamed protein product [Lactuca saligna]
MVVLIFHAYGTNGKICMYVEHDGQGLDDWFGSDVEEEDGYDSCAYGGENEDEIDNLTDLDVKFNVKIVTMNRKKGDDFLNKLCGKEEEGNNQNIDDDNGHEEDANVTQQHSIFNELMPLKSSSQYLGLIEVLKNSYHMWRTGSVRSIFSKTFWKRYIGVQYESLFWKACEATEGGAQAVNEGDEVNEGNQGNVVNEGDEVIKGDQVVNDDGGALEFTPLEFDAPGNREPSQVHVKQHGDKETPVIALLKKIRRKKSKRIIKLKFGKIVGNADAHGNSEANPFIVE